MVVVVVEEEEEGGERPGPSGSEAIDVDEARSAEDTREVKGARSDGGAKGVSRGEGEGSEGAGCIQDEVAEPVPTPGEWPCDRERGGPAPEAAV